MCLLGHHACIGSYNALLSLAEYIWYILPQILTTSSQNFEQQKVAEVCGFLKRQM